MQRNDTTEVSSSHFHLESVSRRTRTLVDMGCQRCQQCTLRRWWAHTDSSATTLVIDQEGPSVNLEEIRSQRCKEA